MNLTTARSIYRSKEVGVRKVIGAQRNDLVKQFLGESFLFTIFAFILASAVIVLSLPQFSAFIQRDIHISHIAPGTIGLLVIIMIFISLIAGSYPALVLAAFKPIRVLQKMLDVNSGGASFRNILVVLQFVISIVLITSTVVIRNQLHYIKNKDVGYNKEQIIAVTLKDEALRDNCDAVKIELLKHPNISKVSASSHLPNNVNWQIRVHWPNMPQDQYVHSYFSVVDYDFLDLYGIKIKNGKGFSRDHPSDLEAAFILNEAAVSLLEWENPVGKDFDQWFPGRSGFKNGKIIGVAKNFHMQSLHNEIKPQYFFLYPKEYLRYISIKINPENISTTIAYIEEQMQQFSPDYPFEYQFFDEICESEYRAEERIAALVSSFAVLAILISCLGLFGLSAYATERRTKEISVRKVLGASVFHVTFLVSREFFKLVVLACVIAIPFAYYIMQNWLFNFAYRISLTWNLFFISGLIAFGIALVTVGYQTVKVAMSNPVDSLRYE